LDNRKLDLSERKFAFHQQTTRQQPPAPEPSPAPEPFMFDYQALSREPKRKVISLSRTPYSSQS
jgi:hypothetical protein